MDITGQYLNSFSIKGHHYDEELRVVIEASISVYDKSDTLQTRIVSKLNSKPIVIKSLMKTNLEDGIDLSAVVFETQVDDYNNESVCCPLPDKSAAVEQEPDTIRQHQAKNYRNMPVQKLRLDCFTVHIPNTDSEKARSSSSVHKSKTDANGISNGNSLPNTGYLSNGISNGNSLQNIGYLSNGISNGNSLPNTAYPSNGISNENSLPNTAYLSNGKSKGNSLPNTAYLSTGISNGNSLPNTGYLYNEISNRNILPNTAYLSNVISNRYSLPNTAYLSNVISNGNGLPNTAYLSNEISNVNSLPNTANLSNGISNGNNLPNTAYLSNVISNVNSSPNIGHLSNKISNGNSLPNTGYLSSYDSYSQGFTFQPSKETSQFCNLAKPAEKQIITTQESDDATVNDVRQNKDNNSEEYVCPIEEPHVYKQELIELLPSREGISDFMKSDDYNKCSDLVDKFADVSSKEDTNVRASAIHMGDDVPNVQFKFETNAMENENEFPHTEPNDDISSPLAKLNVDNMYTQIEQKTAVKGHKRKVGKPRKKPRKTIPKLKPICRNRQKRVGSTQKTARPNVSSEDNILNEKNQANCGQSNSQKTHWSRMPQQHDETIVHDNNSDKTITEKAESDTESDGNKRRSKRRCTRNVSYKAFVDNVETHESDKDYAAPSTDSEPESAYSDKDVYDSEDSDVDCKQATNSVGFETAEITNEKEPVLSYLDRDNEAKLLEQIDVKKKKQIRKKRYINIKKRIQLTKKENIGVKKKKQITKKEMIDVKKKKHITKKYKTNINRKKQITKKQKATSGQVKVSVNLSQHEDKFEMVKFISSEQQNRGKPIDEISHDMYACKICKSFQVIDKNSLSLHIGQHLQGNLRCKFCGIEYSSVRRKVQHMRTDHYSEFADKGTICEQCGKHFESKRLRCRHMYTVHKIPSFQCLLCIKQGKRDVKMFDMPKDIYRHERENHFEDLFVCSKCDRHCLTALAFSQHVAACRGGQVFQCNECSYSSSQKTRLNYHVGRVHRKEKNAKCELCDFKAYIQANVKRHMAHAHQGEEKTQLLFEPHHQKNCLWVSDQVLHKPNCAATYIRWLEALI